MRWSATGKERSSAHETFFLGLGRDWRFGARGPGRDLWDEPVLRGRTRVSVFGLSRNVGARERHSFLAAPQRKLYRLPRSEHGHQASARAEAYSRSARRDSSA